MARTVICDTGSSAIKAGVAGQQEPQLVVPNLIGRPGLRYDVGLCSSGAGLQETVCGEAARAGRSTLTLSSPMRGGIVQNWDDMEAMWDHTFAKLGVDAFAEHRVVQTEPALNPLRSRERLAESMFERYGFAALNISIQAVMALTSQARATGLVVDAGDGTTHLVPVTEGFLEPHLVQRVGLAGQQVTEHLMKLLVGQGHPLNSSADLETVRELKQKLCYIAHDLEDERKFARETTLVDRQYTLPDGRTLRIGAERFLAPELLFEPAQHGREGPGLAELVFNTIRRTDMHLQKELFSNVMLSGGSSMFPGFASRLEKDLRTLHLEQVLQGDRARQSRYPVLVEDPPHRQHLVFLGASIHAQANEGQSNSPWWISRSEFEECGANVVHRLIPTRIT